VSIAAFGMTGISGPPQVPDRRIARTPDRTERQAGAGLTAVAFDFQPAEPALTRRRS